MAKDVDASAWRCARVTDAGSQTADGEPWSVAPAGRPTEEPQTITKPTLKNMKSSKIAVGTWILILCASAAAYGQSIRDRWQEMPATPENFAMVMRMKTPTVAQFDTLWNVVQQYCATDADTCFLLTTHAVRITKNHSVKRLHGEALYLHGRAVIEKDTAAGLNLLRSAREILQQEKKMDTPVMLESFLGLYYARINQYEKALSYQLNALEMAKARKDTASFIRPLMAIGGVYFHLGSLDKAQTYVSEAIKIVEASHEEQPLPTMLSNQAMIFQQMGDQYKAMADTATTAAQVFRDSAAFHYNQGVAATSKGLALARKFAIPTDIVNLLTTLSSLKNSLGDYKTSQSIGQEAMAMAEKLGIPFFLAKSHLNLAVAQRNLGLYADALRHAQAGYAIVEKDPRAGHSYVFEHELFEIYKATGRADLALPLLEKAMDRLKDETKSGIQSAIADAETKYQTAEKEKEILELAIANERVSKQRNYLLMGGIVLGLFGFLGYRFNQVEKDRNDKKAFAEALIFAQEEERKRIGRDLHDGIGQSLLMIKKLMDNTVGVTLENQKMITTTLEEVRAISHDLHPFQLDKFGLTATINDMVLKVEQSTDLFITRDIEDIDKVLDAKSEIHLYRAIQEALSNIVKHAEATAAKVSVQNKADKIVISILDNGKGFDLELAVATSKSLGIRTMHERISAIGGKLKIEKGETNGTYINITVPKLKRNA